MRSGSKEIIKMEGWKNERGKEEEEGLKRGKEWSKMEGGERGGTEERKRKSGFKKTNESKKERFKIRGRK